MTAAQQQEAFAKAAFLRDLEMSLAFERAMTVIDGECTAHEDSDGGEDWLDLESASFDLSQEIEYLESRHLLLHHPDRPNWARICDEDEPCGPTMPDLPGPVGVSEALDQLARQLGNIATLKTALAGATTSVQPKSKGDHDDQQTL